MTDESKLICTLPLNRVPQQLGRWAELRDAALEISRLNDGVAVLFPGELEAAVTDLAAREAECCSFLAIEVTRIGDQVRLEMTSQVLGADQVVTALLGEPT